MLTGKGEEKENTQWILRVSSATKEHEEMETKELNEACMEQVTVKKQNREVSKLTGDGNNHNTERPPQ